MRGVGGLGGLAEAGLGWGRHVTHTHPLRVRHLIEQGLPRADLVLERERGGKSGKREGEMHA